MFEYMSQMHFIVAFENKSVQIFEFDKVQGTSTCCFELDFSDKKIEEASVL